MENVESGTVVLSHRVRDAVCVPLPSATPGIFERAIETMIRVPLLPSFPWHTLGSMEIRSLQSNSIMIFPPVSGKADLPLQGCTDRVNAISSIIPLSAKLKTKSSPMITLSSTFTQWASMQQKVFCEKPVRFACLRCPGWMIAGYNHPGGIELQSPCYNKADRRPHWAHWTASPSPGMRMAWAGIEVLSGPPWWSQIVTTSRS